MNARMAGLLKPLAIFCSQPQSQRYIKTIHNLGDSWRTLADTSNLTSFAADQDKIIIYVEAADALSSFPHSVFQNYNAWVDTYTDNFKKRCEATQDYSANVFLTAAEQVAWQIAGYLLA
jgi:hypothetical protein